MPNDLTGILAVTRTRANKYFQNIKPKLRKMMNYSIIKINSIFKSNFCSISLLTLGLILMTSCNPEEPGLGSAVPDSDIALENGMLTFDSQESYEKYKLTMKETWEASQDFYRNLNVS